MKVKILEKNFDLRNLNGNIHTRNLKKKLSSRNSGWNKLRKIRNDKIKIYYLDALMGDEEEVVLSRMNDVGIHDGSWRNVLATAALD